MVLNEMKRQLNHCVWCYGRAVWIFDSNIISSWWVFDLLFEVPGHWHRDTFISQVHAIFHSNIAKSSSSVIPCVHHFHLFSFVRDCLLFCIFSNGCGIVDIAGTGQKGLCRDRRERASRECTHKTQMSTLHQWQKARYHTPIRCVV